ncbi:MAG TPA: cyclase family protein [Myxococcota bacterium]
MDATLRLGPYIVDVDRRRDCSLPIEFHREHSRAFSLPAASSHAVEGGGFVGDVRRGGSCNCETHTLTPHADGTHTEGPGHLLAERLPVSPPPPVQLAVVVRVAPRLLGESVDDVSGNHRHDDRVIDQAMLIEAIAALDAHSIVGATALVIATMGGARSRAANHSGTNPAYLTVDAAAFIKDAGFMHLLVDLPSIDREDDGGLLAAHRAFFELPTGLGATVPTTIAPRTVTELCVVDDDIAPGPWALFLQVAPIAADAAPSRPLLAPLRAAPAAEVIR